MITYGVRKYEKRNFRSDGSEMWTAMLKQQTKFHWTRNDGITEKTGKQIKGMEKGDGGPRVQPCFVRAAGETINGCAYNERDTAEHRCRLES